jgi:hypothetical protein
MQQQLYPEMLHGSSLRFATDRTRLRTASESTPESTP